MPKMFLRLTFEHHTFPPKCAFTFKLYKCHKIMIAKPSITVGSQKKHGQCTVFSPFKLKSWEAQKSDSLVIAYLIPQANDEL